MRFSDMSVEELEARQKRKFKEAGEEAIKAGIRSNTDHLLIAILGVLNTQKDILFELNKKIIKKGTVIKFD